MIEFLKYIFLGIVQGITEALPISSSGHLLIFSKIINANINYDTLAILTNAGSLIAVIIVFRKEILKLIKGFFSYISKKTNLLEFRYCWLLVIACIPAGLVGVIVKKLDLLDKIESNVKIVGISLIVTAALLFWIRKFDGKKTDKDIRPIDALKIGTFQILGLLPGISRSGSTIVGGMVSDLSRDTAFKFSFILYIPMSLAATALELKDLFEGSISGQLWLYYGVATLAAFVFTLLVIKWFRKLVKEGKIWYFSIYCLIAGLLVILFLK